jgi:hypothetical protein
LTERQADPGCRGCYRELHEAHRRLYETGRDDDEEMDAFAVPTLPTKMNTLLRSMGGSYN